MTTLSSLLMLLLVGMAHSGSSVGDTHPSPYRNVAAKIEDLKKRLLANEKDIATRVELAEQLILQENYAETIIYLKGYTNQLSRHGFLLLAKAYHGQKEYLSEIRILSLVLVHTPDDPFVETLLAKAYLDNKNKVEAVKHYRKAIAIDPQFIGAYTGLLATFDVKAERADGRRTIDLFEARQLLEQMVPLFPTHNQFRNQLCDLYTQESLIQKALEVCAQAIEKDPNTPENHVNLATAYHLDKNEDRSLKIIYQAAKRFTQSASTQCAAGRSAMRSGDTTSAVNYFKRSVTLDPKQPDCQIALGEAAFAAEQYELALAAYNAACKIHRRYAGPLRKAAATLTENKNEKWRAPYVQAANRCIDY